MKDISLGLMNGKRGMIFGVANDRSLAWHIAERLHAEGAELAFTHLPPPKMEPMKSPKSNSSPNRQIGPLDFIVHAIAYANRAALHNPFHTTSRADFAQAMDISVYSLVALCQHGLRYMNEGGSVLTLTYLGAVKMLPNYNVMGVCKAALESAVRYLAAELGRDKNIRVNALSAGPVQTLSAAGVEDFDRILRHYPQKAPLHRNIRPDEIGTSGLYLLSDLSSGVTGEIHYVDCGYSTVGW